MKHNRVSSAVVFVCVMSLFKVEVSYAATIHQEDPSGRDSNLSVHFDDGRIVEVDLGETLIVREQCKKQVRSELGWLEIPVKPIPTVKISLKQMDAVRQEPFLAAMMLNPRRRIMLNYPPVSSVWHLPAGVSQLTSVLRRDGHEVVQRFGHILGLEHLLNQHGGSDVATALRSIRDPDSGILALYQARMTMEQVSRLIETLDRFAVERNNVNYVPAGFDGTIESLWNVVRRRDEHLWHGYFMNVEVPLALDFQPDLYGVSVADERQFVPGIVLASLIKDAIPRCKIVLGGNFWSRITHAFQLPGMERIFDHCDAVVFKEGFKPLRRLASDLDSSKVAGIIWRSGDKVVINPSDSRPSEFEDLPTPAFDGGAMQWSPDPVYPLYTMSNCPMACGFCAISAGSDTYLGKPRSMSPRRIAEHMAALGNRFDVFDETFSIPRQLALGRELKRIEHSATWQCYLTVTNDLANPAVSVKLYDAGCRAVQLGLETLSTETLRRERKQWNSPKNYRQILANLRSAGIQTHVFLIAGLPGEPLNWGFKWLPFLEQYGDYILTIKAGRYRLTRQSPEEVDGMLKEWIEVLPDTKPLRLNRDFRYRSISFKKIDAMRDLLEEACRRHWAYGVTSTIPWWANRGRYSLGELRQMSRILPAEPEVRHLKDAIAKARTIVKEELGQDAGFSSFQDLVDFSRTL